MEFKRVGVIGCGTIGCGWATFFLNSGIYIIPLRGR